MSRKGHDKVTMTLEMFISTLDSQHRKTIEKYGQCSCNAHAILRAWADERRRLREKMKALTVHTTIKGSGIDAEVVDCYTVDDIAALFGDTP